MNKQGKSNFFKITVNSMEAIKLTKYLPCTNLTGLLEMYNTTFNNVMEETKSNSSWKWCHFCALLTVWNSGRIQGVREERKKRAERNISKAV